MYSKTAVALVKLLNQKSSLPWQKDNQLAHFMSKLIFLYCRRFICKNTRLQVVNNHFIGRLNKNRVLPVKQFRHCHNRSSEGDSKVTAFGRCVIPTDFFFWIWLFYFYFFWQNQYSSHGSITCTLLYTDMPFWNLIDLNAMKRTLFLFMRSAWHIIRNLCYSWSWHPHSSL